MKKTIILFIVLFSLFMAAVLMYIFKPLGEGFFIIADLAVASFSFLAFLSGLSAFRFHGHKSMQGRALLFLSLGVLFWFLGESTWAVYEIVLGIEAPTASFADLMWLLGYPFFAAGLYFEWKITRIGKTKSGKIVLLLASAAAASVLGIMLTAIDTGMSPLEKYVAISYVIGDTALLIGSTAIIISFIGGKLTRPWIIITASIALSSIADIAYSFLGSEYNTGNMIDLLWDLYYLLLAYGFLCQKWSVQKEAEKFGKVRKDGNQRRRKADFQ